MRVVDVSAGSGVVWIREAWGLFRAQPLAWLSLTAAWAMLSIILLAVPLIGGPLASMLQPAFFAGFVLACRDQEMGKQVEFGHLFAGLKLSGRTLIQVGSVVLLAELLVLIALNAFGFFDGIRAIEQDKLSMKAISDALQGKEMIWFAALAALIAIKGFFWFTAALIAHQPMPASHAIRWSFFALIGNFIPLVIFAVIMFMLLTLATLPWLLGLLVFFPIYAISHYTSFRAVFRADADAPSPNGDAIP